MDKDNWKGWANENIGQAMGELLGQAPKHAKEAGPLAILGTVGLTALVRIADAAERIATVLEAQELRAVQAQMELAASRGDGQSAVQPFPECPWRECQDAPSCAAAHACAQAVGGWSSSSSTVPGGA